MKKQFLNQVEFLVFRISQSIPLGEKEKGKDLEPWQKGLNTILSKIRSGVEHIFARWKIDFKMKDSRYSGQKKVHAFHCGMAVAYNFHRLGFLLRQKPGWSLENSV